MSCQRFVCREPGAFVCASSSTRMSAGPARERGVEVELLELHASVLGLAPRHDLETEQERAGVVAAVRLDDAHDDVAALLALEARRLEHRVGLSDPGRRAEEDRQLDRG